MNIVIKRFHFEQEKETYEIKFYAKVYVQRFLELHYFQSCNSFPICSHRCHLITSIQQSLQFYEHCIYAFAMPTTPNSQIPNVFSTQGSRSTPHTNVQTPNCLLSFHYRVNNYYFQELRILPVQQLNTNFYDGNPFSSFRHVWQVQLSSTNTGSKRI